MFLNDDEIIVLTGRRRRNAQARALVLMGLEHKIRPDGSVVVLRAHVEKVLGGVAVTVKPKVRDVIDWTALEEAERLKAEKRRL